MYAHLLCLHGALVNTSPTDEEHISPVLFVSLCIQHHEVPVHIYAPHLGVQCFGVLRSYSRSCIPSNVVNRLNRKDKYSRRLFGLEDFSRGVPG